jgi:hypothetical protein
LKRSVDLKKVKNRKEGAGVKSSQGYSFAEAWRGHQ